MIIFDLMMALGEKSVQIIAVYLVGTQMSEPNFKMVDSVNH